MQGLESFSHEFLQALLGQATKRPKVGIARALACSLLLQKERNGEVGGPELVYHRVVRTTQRYKIVHTI
jgi:hypothetical protein